MGEVGGGGTGSGSGGGVWNIKTFFIEKRAILTTYNTYTYNFIPTTEKSITFPQISM